MQEDLLQKIIQKRRDKEKEKHEKYKFEEIQNEKAGSELQKMTE